MSLKVSFSGLEFENPFILASAPPTRNGEMIMRGLAEGWGGAVTKTITLKGTSSPHPRLSASQGDARNSILENIELLSDYGADTWSRWLREIKMYFPNPVIASIMAGAGNPGEWADLSEMMIESGAAGVELNVSCPHGMPERAGGAFIGQDAVLTGEITAAVRERISAPLWVKLTPNVTDITAIGRAAQKAGADALAAINTIAGISGVDLETLTPLPDVGGFSTAGGISGAGIKPVALRCVANLAKLRIPVSGMGGIGNWEDAAEFILLGAGTVQVCTSVMFHGYGIIYNLKSGLEGYLRRKGFSSPEEMRGKALEKLVAYERLDFTHRVKYIVGAECYLCGECVTACRDGGFQAITLGKKRALINQKKCDACGLCEIVCPVGAIFESK